MFGKKSVDTLVAGAGPSGMIAALTLADAGHDVAIIDSAPRTTTGSQSAILHPSTLKTLMNLGIGDRVIDAGYSVQRISIYDGSSHRHTLNLDQNPYEPSFALSIPQAELELILEEELDLSGVRINWNQRLSEFTDSSDGLEINVDRYSERGTGYAVSHMERIIDKTIHYHARTLIAADGYNSILRRIAGAEQLPLGDSQYFVSFEFETDTDPDHTCFLSIKDDLVTAQQPMSPGVARLLFQFKGLSLPSRNREKDRSYFQNTSELPEYLDDKHFNELVAKRVPWHLGAVNKLRYRAAIPYEKRYLPRPHLGNVIFLGDSARSFSPLGSLSVNLGMQEAEKIALAILDSINNTQQQAERLEGLCAQMTQTWRQLANLKGVTIPSDSTDPWVAKHRANILRSLPATGYTLAGIAEQIQVELDLQRNYQLFM